MKIIEIYSKGCLSCDYMYRLQKRLDVYDKITHIENTSKEAVQYNITLVPTFIVIYKGTIVHKYEGAGRKELEYIKATYLD